MSSNGKRPGGSGKPTEADYKAAIERAKGRAGTEAAENSVADSAEFWEAPPREERDPDPKVDYGGGKWYWPKSWEADNPAGPVAYVSASAEYLAIKMTNHCSVQRSWIICCSLPYLSRMCAGKLKRSAISYLLDELESVGFAKRLWSSNKKEARDILVNPWMMAKHRAVTFKNYERAAKLVIRPPAPKPPRKRRSPKPRSVADQQLFLEEQLRKASAATPPAGLQ